MRIMFMGTPEISAVCLQALIDGGKEVVAVVTGEDKPRGRGKIMTPTETNLKAKEYGIDVYTPKTLKTEEFAKILREVNPDIIVVVAYGKILPKSVLDYPEYGCINVHVSLLPKYRGAAPMQRAIMNGERETGVTVMYMNEGLDTGDIISCEKFPILKTDDFESIHDKSAEVGGKLLVKTLQDIEEGKARRTPQDSAFSTYAAKIEKSDCKIDFKDKASRIDCIIRGLTPIPGAYAYQGDKMLKIVKAEPTDGKGVPGEVIFVDSHGDGYFTVACGEGALKIKFLIPQGKGRMSAGDYIRGRKIKLGDIIK